MIFILPGYHIFQLTAHLTEFFETVDKDKWNRFIIMEKDCDEYDLLHDRNIALFLSAGDPMTISYSIMVKKPMLLFPQWQYQQINAHKLNQLNVAMTLDVKQLQTEPEYLVNTITEMLENYSVYQLNAVNTFKKLSHFGGCEKAVDVIEFVVAYGYQEWKLNGDSILIPIICLISILMSSTVLVTYCMISNCSKKRKLKYKTS